MVICKAAELARDRIGRASSFVDALALMPGERVGDIVKRGVGQRDDLDHDRTHARRRGERALCRSRSRPARLGPGALHAASVAALEAPVELGSFWTQTWPTTVIRCRRAMNPPEAHQRRTAERLKAAWHELDTGHYPMLSQPEELTRLLLAPVS